MLVMPSDADGLVLPTARPSEAWSAVTALSRAERSACAAGERLAASASAAAAWDGRAAEEYLARRAELSGRLAELSAVAGEAATVIRGWSREADAAITAMRSARGRVVDATARVDAARAQARYWTPELTADLDRARESWERAKISYWDAVGRAAARLLALRDRVAGRPWDGTDQLTGFYHGLRDGLVVEPVSLVWGLTGESVVDRDQWWANVSGLPGMAWSAVTEAVRHPLRTAAQAVDADAWIHGRYGEGAAVAATFLPRSQVLHFGPREGRLRYARAVLDPAAPKPRLQTVDEMLAGVDLTRHEHAEYGHTISRHVAVDDGYLADRLAHGTLERGGQRGPVPPEASRFSDLDTAERMVTETLRANESGLRAFSAGAGPPGVAFRLATARDVGVVMRVRGGGFAVRDSGAVVVRMARGPDGPYVVTAYLE